MQPVFCGKYMDFKKETNFIGKCEYKFKFKNIYSFNSMIRKKCQKINDFTNWTLISCFVSGTMISAGISTFG